MRVWVAGVLEQLLVERVAGDLLPPGGKCAIRVDTADELIVSVMSRGEALDFYYGKKRVVTFSVPARAALRVGLFLVWTWWVRGTWCGLKLALWKWVRQVRFDEILLQRTK